MKLLLKISAALILVISLASFLIPKAVNSNKTLKNPLHKGFAFVELYTSEGCSSCPPADEVFRKIQGEYKNMKVYLLAFHVDYWNRLGWKDIFSQSSYSTRQRQYAEWLKLESVYTPQAIVNGKTEFIGSEEGKLRNSIKSQLNQSDSWELSLSSPRMESKSVITHFNINQSPGAHYSINLALVQKYGISHVQGGENEGRTLSHVQIVRNLKTQNLGNSTQGDIRIDLPEGFSTKDLELIAFIQNQNSGEILSATQSPISPSL